MGSSSTYDPVGNIVELDDRAVTAPIFSGTTPISGDGFYVYDAIYRLSGGRLAGHFGRGLVLLLTVPGRKSGKPQTVPLIYVDTDRGYAIVASFAGSPTHPAWYLNLEAAGVADIQGGSGAHARARRRRATRQRALR